MKIKGEILLEQSRINALRRIPQTKPSGFELAVYPVCPLLLIAMGAMPSVAVFFFPVVLCLLYILFRRFGAALPLSCLGCYGLLSLTLNYDILSVLYFVGLFFSFCGLLLSAQLRPFMLCAAVAGGAAIIGFLGGLGIVRLAEGQPIEKIAAEYAMEERDDPFISFLARYNYDNTEFPEDIEKKKEGEAGYYDECARFYSEYIGRDMGNYAPYYCVHIAGISALLAYFTSVLVNRRTSSAYDFDATEQTVSLSTRAMGGVRVEMSPVKDMRIPRSFLWAVVLPAIVTTSILDIVGGYAGLSATIMHAFVTIPAAFAFITLGAYFASLFKGRAKYAAYSVFYLLCAAAAVFPLALFIFSVLGICDVILNLRFWTEFLKSD